MYTFFKFHFDGYKPNIQYNKVDVTIDTESQLHEQN